MTRFGRSQTPCCESAHFQRAPGKHSTAQIELTDRQRIGAEENLNCLDDQHMGDLRIWLLACFHAAKARAITCSLTAMPWDNDEDSVARLIDRTKGTLSQLKIPGKHDSEAPAIVALRTRWKFELENQSDLKIRGAVKQLHQFGCVQYFERLGIFAFSRLLSNESTPGATGDLLDLQTLRWIQEAIFFHQWLPDGTTPISLTAIKLRYPAASESDVQNMANVMSQYGIAALLFYHLTSAGDIHDQLK